MQISEHLYRFDDTCAVYALLDGDRAVLVDFGDGSVIDRLAELGVHSVTDVLMTHHHRDQGQGLPRLAATGARIWAPHAEQELFAGVDAFWQARQVRNNYNVRQDRFSLLEPVLLAGTLQDYSGPSFGSYSFKVLPTPGHTPGSLSLLAEVDGRRVAFTGDLIAGPGKVWSLAATQWTYNGAEGVAASIASLLDLKDQVPDLLLPSHGQTIFDPGPAIDLLVERLADLLAGRGENGRLFALHAQPYERITPHLLLNRTSEANSYVLLSKSGSALLIDFGYDFMTGEAAGTERAARRPWLHSLPALKHDFGVRRVEVAIPTHYHDDHVAGFNLLRAAEGTQVWAAESFADLLEQPGRYDLPCLWHDPIPVDRRLPVETPFTWQEYQLCLYPLLGHTRYSVAITFEVDGLRVLATGDQDVFDPGPRWNYVYQNRFELSGYRLSAALYARLQPDLFLTGHWGPQRASPALLAQLQERGEALERLHQHLLLPDEAGQGAEGFDVQLHPYSAVVHGGQPIELEMEVRSNRRETLQAVARLVAPPGWKVEEEELYLHLAPFDQAQGSFHVTPPLGKPAPRARLAVDLTVGNLRLGQQAEALVTVLYPDLAPASIPARVALPGTPEVLSKERFQPVLDRDFPDPGLVQVNGLFYAYATNSAGVHVQAACSPDLLHWEFLGEVLPELPTWAVQRFGYTWAPEVCPPLVEGGSYRMYFVTRFANSGGGLQAIGLAIAPRPEGPFQCVGKKPLLCQVDCGGSIDPSIFVDEDGSAYLVWKNDGNAVHQPTWISLQRLSPDGMRLEGKPGRLVTADRPWEGSVIEAPVLWKQAGKYYLFYSANDFTSSRYAIGWAVSSSPGGPYRKCSRPLLASDTSAGLDGPGGQTVVHTPNGETWMLFHAWRPGRYRALYASRLEWGGDGPRVTAIRQQLSVACHQLPVALPEKIIGNES